MSHPKPSPTPTAPSAPDHRRAESGSAYLVAILALVVLTIAGLSLALITQTEMQIGANERVIERAFFAAESGISMATARTLVARAAAEGDQYVFGDPEGTGVELEHYVVVSPFFPISRGPCNLTNVDYSGDYESRWERAVHLVNSTAVRRIPGTEVPLAERALSAMVEIQCFDLQADYFKPAASRGDVVGALRP